MSFFPGTFEQHPRELYLCQAKFHIGTENSGGLRLRQQSGSYRLNLGHVTQGQNTRGRVSYVRGKWQNYLNLSEHLLICEATSPSLSPAQSPRIPLRKEETPWIGGGTSRRDRKFPSQSAYCKRSLLTLLRAA